MATIDAYDGKHGRLWRVIYRKPDGAQTTRRGFKRKRDAQEWLAEHVTIAKASGSFVDPQAGRRKVDTLWPAWIAKKRVSSKASYIESLERAWRVHVEPKWGARTLESLTRGEIQEWVSAQAETKSATVVLRNLGILRGICADATADRLIASNPCAGVETPRKKRKEHTYLTIDQLFRLADESGSRRTMVLVLGLCGLRWGEMAGLQSRTWTSAGTACRSGEAPPPSATRWWWTCPRTADHGRWCSRERSTRRCAGNATEGTAASRSSHRRTADTWRAPRIRATRPNGSIMRSCAPASRSD